MANTIQRTASAVVRDDVEVNKSTTARTIRTSFSCLFALSIFSFFPALMLANIVSTLLRDDIALIPGFSLHIQASLFTIILLGTLMNIWLLSIGKRRQSLTMSTAVWAMFGFLVGIS